MKSLFLLSFYLELNINTFPEKNNITDVWLLQLTNDKEEKIVGKSGD